jgi:hypothetical protein
MAKKKQEAKDVRDADDVIRDYVEQDEHAEDEQSEVREQFETAEDVAGRRNRSRRASGESTAQTPELSGGDVDAAWDQADVGEETVGGSSPTPDQDIVEELGKGAGVTYEDNEELAPEDKLAARDDRRWELNPASSEDYQERQEEEGLRRKRS